MATSRLMYDLLVMRVAPRVAGGCTAYVCIWSLMLCTVYRLNEIKEIRLKRQVTLLWRSALNHNVAVRSTFRKLKAYVLQFLGDRLLP